MFHRSQWAVAHAVTDQRPAGFVAAEAYAIAAMTFWPANRDALNLLNDIERTMEEEEAQPWPTYKKALTEFDEYAFQPIDRYLNEEASALEAGALEQVNRGRLPFVTFPISVDFARRTFGFGPICLYL
jgi:hypothetical protein